MARRQTNNSDTSISRVLQDTFDELQAELVRQKQQLEEESDAPPQVAGSIEDLVNQLARNEGFEVQSLLGAGGMGAVVRATDLKLKRTVALKFLPPEVLSDLQNAQELRREAEIASNIQNENVVQIFSWHEVDNVPFYAMEFVEGETVDQYVNRRGKLPLVEALRITAEAARGLEALHRAGIIHRDIKPQNILLARDGRVKITDFGISRTQDMITSEITKTRKIAGTPKFMAPEQARGEAATKHSDIYSLGATFYFMLTGRSPVEAATDIREQIKYVREGRIVPIQKLIPKIDPSVTKLVGRCLSSTQSRRPWDVENFRQELDRLFLAETVQSSSGFTHFLVANRRYLFMTALLVAGAVAGFIAGEQVIKSRYSAHSSAEDAVFSAAQQKATSLGEFQLLFSEDDKVMRIHQSLLDAIERRDTDLATRLLPEAAALERRLETMMLLRREAADPSSPMHREAVQILSALSSGQPDLSGTVIDQWRGKWLSQVGRSPVSTPEPKPVLQPANAVNPPLVDPVSETTGEGRK